MTYPREFQFQGVWITRTSINCATIQGDAFAFPGWLLDAIEERADR